MTERLEFDDWVVAPNIVGDPDTYELENEAILRDGRLDTALCEIAPLDGQVVLDVGCGTGFWLAQYATSASRVFGVEPDRHLLEIASVRTGELPTVEVVHGSAEHLPLDDHSVDVVHARFAYFFGEGADAGLDEVRRVLVPGGTFLAVDNSWTGGDFARLLRASANGNAAIDPPSTERWWAERGARRHEVEGGWSATSREELERILRIEFPGDVVTDFMGRHDSPQLSYHFAVYEYRAPTES